MSKWKEKERVWLRNNYSAKGKIYCANYLERSEGSIRWMASKMDLSIDINSEFYKEWQTRSASSKVGKMRPAQAEVMRRNHAYGKLVKTA